MYPHYFDTIIFINPSKFVHFDRNVYTSRYTYFGVKWKFAENKYYQNHANASMSHKLTRVLSNAPSLSSVGPQITDG